MASQKYIDRIEKLRNEMEKKGICLYLIPMNDDHGSEYMAPHFKQIAYYSGFTGSAGMLVVTKEETLLWTDGRYFLQAGQELLKSAAKLMKMGGPGVPTVIDYMVAYVQRQADDKLSQSSYGIGFDGRLLSFSYIEALRSAWQNTKSEKELKIYPQEDISGKLWEEDKDEPRPKREQKEIWILDKQYCQTDVCEKLTNVRIEMEKEKQDMLILSALDEIAWLLNLRGDDIAYNPVFYSFMTVEKEKTTLYIIDVPQEIREYLTKAGITVKSYDSFYEDIRMIEDMRIWVDDRCANYMLVASISPSNRVKRASSPVYRQKAIKNETEIDNIKKAHVLDGVAVTKFIYWLKTKVGREAETATEISAAEKLESLRKQGDGYLGQSFAPIMAYGAHGAIVHYEADETSNIRIQNESFLLSDTGGHYLTGTTDITRTIAMGPLTERQKEHYTAVLMGNLRLMNAIFKQGMQGCHLDYIARQPLYERGLDFNHGTGHGVGYLLNVHEGPNAFRQKPDTENVFFQGMVTSDEPGYYLEDQYGIRLENLILCVEKEKTEYGTFLGFEPLTLVPFDTQAIDFSMMTDEDKKLLDAYHTKVWNEISPFLTQEEKEWLRMEIERKA